MAYIPFAAGPGYATMMASRLVVFWAEVNNVADKQYRASSGLGSPRTFALSAKVTW